MRSPPRKRRSCALTLTELLFLVGTICVLTACLFPTLNIAIAKARTVSCTQNLRSIHRALMAHAADHNGLVPPYRKKNNGSFWYSLMEPYLQWRSGASYVRGRCPNQPKSFVEFQYVMNSGITGQTDDFSWNLQSVAEPSLAFVVGETPLGRGVSYRVSYSQTDPSRPDHELGYNHDARASLLFLDGHVERRRPEEIPQPDQRVSTRPGYLQWKRFWHPHLNP